MIDTKKGQRNDDPDKLLDSVCRELAGLDKSRLEVLMDELGDEALPSFVASKMLTCYDEFIKAKIQYALGQDMMNAEISVDNARNLLTQSIVGALDIVRSHQVKEFAVKMLVETFELAYLDQAIDSVIGRRR